MSSENPKNIPASVHARLMNKARDLNRPFNEVLQYYAMERFLYRLSKSKYMDKFVLKGALMLRVWGIPDARPTMDIDLEGRLSNEQEVLIGFVRDCMKIECPDGVTFDKSSIREEIITEDADYQGTRLTFKGNIGNATLNFQLDIGFGDPIVPEPESITYPQLLDLGCPQILAYSPETSIAEKLQAMVELDAANSRMKDFYDIDKLAGYNSFEGNILQKAISATFSQRKTVISENIPALNPSFAENEIKKAQWNAFINKLENEHKENDMATVIGRISTFLRPVIKAIAENNSFNKKWQPGGPWQG